MSTLWILLTLVFVVGCCGLCAFIAPLYQTSSAPVLTEEPNLAESNGPLIDEVRVPFLPFEVARGEPIRQAVPGASEGSSRKFQFELIPRAMHFKNARAVLPVDAWCYLRALCLRSAGETCEACGSTERGELECHEEWAYQSLRRNGLEEPVHVMKLKGLRALCRLCHRGKHIGFTKKNADDYIKVTRHLFAVHGMSKEEFSQLKQEAFEEVNRLNECGIRELDLTYLNDDRFRWVRHRAKRNLFTTNELANCRQPIANEDLAA